MEFFFRGFIFRYKISRRDSSEHHGTNMNPNYRSQESIVLFGTVYGLLRLRYGFGASSRSSVGGFIMRKYQDGLYP